MMKVKKKTSLKKHKILKKKKLKSKIKVILNLLQSISHTKKSKPHTTLTFFFYYFV